MAQEIKVPDIGDADAVEVIEVLVAAGDDIELEQALITLESDKATLEVPATVAGRITEMQVAEGDSVSEGDVIAWVEAAADTGEPKGDTAAASPETKRQPPQASTDTGTETASAQKKPQPAPPSDGGDYDCDVLVLGSGPGGYTAAFRAADLGLRVTLVERHGVLGGVCLNVGCIPSKALLHSAKVIEDAANMASHGVSFGPPEINLGKLLGYKQSVIDQLTGGLKSMAAKRKVKVVRGSGTFADAHTLAVAGSDGASRITFKNAIVAVGSEPVMLPGLPDDECIWDSEAALSPNELPGSMLLIGGGIIGVEIANVYAAHGTTVDIVEMTEGLLPGVDRDLVKPLHKRMAGRCNHIWVNTKVTRVTAGDQLQVDFEGQDAPATAAYDRVLVAVGRKPNGNTIGAAEAGLEVDGRGFIPIDKQCRTNVDHIFAIGDVSGEPQLAHRASHQGKVAAECCAGEKSAFDAKVIPSVVYTDPEVAWTGVTETQAKAEGIEYTKGAFPWAANGRAIGLDANDGNTKLLFDAQNGCLIGAGAVGTGAGDLIAETCLAIEMGADARDIGLTIHPHPTLAETVGMAAEAEAGVLTDLYIPKKNK